MDPSRRAFLQRLGTLTTGMVLSSQFPDPPLFAEHLVPDLSQATVANLATITHQYRQMQRQGNTFIMAGVNAHIHMLHDALGHTTQEQVWHDLWRILARTQLVAGFQPVRKEQRGQAKTFLESAIASARNSGDALFVGATLGHLAQFSFREEHNIRKAVLLLSQAQTYTPTSHPLFGWLTLLLASLAAKMGDEPQCESALQDALTIAHDLPATPSFDDLYCTDFSLISTQVFMIHSWLTLGNARKSHEQLALTNVDALADNRRASAYCDASRTYALIGADEMAQHLAFQAIDKARATHQLYVIPRCLTVAQTLQRQRPESSSAAAITEYVHLAQHHPRGEG
jgi:hypothetical protein